MVDGTDNEWTGALAFYTRDEIKLVNCAGCNAELVGISMTGWYTRLKDHARRKLPPIMAGRVDGRPYCLRCIGVRRRSRAEEGNGG